MEAAGRYLAPASPGVGRWRSIISHLCDHGNVLIDEEGRELVDARAIADAALVEARAIVAAEARGGTINLDQSIEVRDAGGGVVHRLPFAEAVTIRS